MGIHPQAAQASGSRTCAQIVSGGLSDIRQVGELLHSGAVNFVWVHDG
jgi:hypothetical protein